MQIPAISMRGGARWSHVSRWFSRLSRGLIIPNSNSFHVLVRSLWATSGKNPIWTDGLGKLGTYWLTEPGHRKGEGAARPQACPPRTPHATDSSSPDSAPFWVSAAALQAISLCSAGCHSLSSPLFSVPSPNENMETWFLPSGKGSEWPSSVSGSSLDHFRCLPMPNLVWGGMGILEDVRLPLKSLRRLLKVSWTARRSNQPILKKINAEYSLEGLMLKF